MRYPNWLIDSELCVIVSKLLVRCMVLCIRAYKIILSPYIGWQCRFFPTCSSYAISALNTHGVIKGGGYTAYRLVRCNPWCKGGVDEVPIRK